MNAKQAVNLKNSRFSKLRLIVFTLIFGAVGIFILKSLAAPNPNLPGDLNNDNTVNVTDLSILLSNYGTTNATADINTDGSVNVLDLSILLSNYGKSGASSGSAYYVSITGSDSNSGSQTSPWRTIGHAAGIVAAGSTVSIASGNYGENLSLNNPGTNGNPINFIASGTVTIKSLVINASYVALKGFEVAGSSSNCVTIATKLTDITIDGGSIHNCAQDGIHFNRPNPYSNYADYSNNVKVKNLKIYNAGTSGSSNLITVLADNSTFQDNEMYWSTNDAIDMWGDHLSFIHNNIHDICDGINGVCNSNTNHNDAFQSWTGIKNSDGTLSIYDNDQPVTNLLIDRNIIHNVTGDNAHCGIAEGPGYSNWTITNNLAWNVSQVCWVLATNDTSGNPTEPGISNVSVYNNTFVNAGTVDTVEFNSGTTGKLVNNIFYNTARSYFKVAYNVTQSHNLYANPGFVNASSDFHLAANSAAINAGDSSGMVPIRSADLDGSPTVGIVDIGAYEYQ